MSTKTSTSFYFTHRSEQARWLRENHPFAMLLMLVIAERVRWSERNNKMKLELLQCVIGTTEVLWKGCTRRQLRTAIKTLECCREIVTKTTNKGTVVTLINNDIITIRTNKKDQQTTNERPTEGELTATNIEGNRKREGISLPLYFSDTNVIHALAIELNKSDDSIKNLAEAFIKHCGFLKTSYSNNAAFALQRDFKMYVTQQQQTNNNPYKVPYGVLYSK